MDRSKIIIRTSLISILVNAITVVFKMFVGAATGSIAIMLDAINNLADTLGSVITIIGTKLSGKQPDKEHPYGYGRIEYLASIVVSALVLTAGISAFKESVLSVMHPTETSYDAVSLFIIVVALFVKLALGTYVKKTGKKIGSASLVASGSEALFDSVTTVASLVAAFITITFHKHAEGIFGAIIAVFIIKTGVELLLETAGNIIGRRAEANLTLEIKKRIAAIEGVNGAYDLIIHNYGPSEMLASIHVEVGDDMTARQMHKLTYEIQKVLYSEYHMKTTVGFYAANDTNPEDVVIKEKLREVIRRHKEVLQFHAFFVDREVMMVTFDMVVDFKADQEAVAETVKEELKKAMPEFDFDITLDPDFSD